MVYEKVGNFTFYWSDEYVYVRHISGWHTSTEEQDLTVHGCPFKGWLGPDRTWNKPVVDRWRDLTRHMYQPVKPLNAPTLT